MSASSVGIWLVIITLSLVINLVAKKPLTTAHVLYLVLGSALILTFCRVTIKMIMHDLWPWQPGFWPI